MKRTFARPRGRRWRAIGAPHFGAYSNKIAWFVRTVIYLFVANCPFACRFGLHFKCYAGTEFLDYNRTMVKPLWGLCHRCERDMLKATRDKHWSLYEELI